MCVWKRDLAGCLCAAVVLLAVLSLTALGLPGDAALLSDVVFASAEWIQLKQVSGTPTVLVEADAVRADVGTLLCPGAYGLLRLEVVNRGAQDVQLLTADAQLAAEAPIQIQLPAFLTEGGQCRLSPGEHCVLDILIRWDPESTDTDVELDGAFTVTLTYEGSDVITGDDPIGKPDKPSAGDPFPLVYWAGVAVSLGTAVWLLKRRNRTAR